MRINVYEEELTDHLEIVTKDVDGKIFTGLRFYLELPVTKDGEQIKGPFYHRPGDDDSSAVTLWGGRGLKPLLAKAIAKLDAHFGEEVSSDA